MNVTSPSPTNMTFLPANHKEEITFSFHLNALSETSVSFCIHSTMNSTEEHHQAVPQIPYAVVFGFIMSLGFPLNATALWILLRHHNLKSSNVIFMVNLAVSDLLLVVSLPLQVYFYATGTWPLGDIACVGVTAFFTINIQSSTVFITFISVDRLLAVAYPLRSRHVRTASNALKAAIFGWLFLIITSIPRSVLFAGHLKQHKESFCFEHPEHEHDHKYLARYNFGIFQVIFVLILLTVNIVSTVLVSWSLNHLSDSAKVKNKVNVMLNFVMSLVMFAVCFLPVSIGLLINGTHSYLTCIATANCCLDPLLYYFSLDAFWKKKEERNQLTTSNSLQRHIV